MSKQMAPFPYPFVDPLSIFVDDEIRPFDIDKRQDLTGTGDEACPKLSTGVYIVHEHVVPEATAEIVFGVFPHVWQRVAVEAANEAVQAMSPTQLSGYVAFDVARGTNQPVIVETDYNSPTIASAPQNNQRSTVRGSTLIPGVGDAQSVLTFQLTNPLGAFYLPAKSTLRVLFRLMPAATTSPIQGYTIGGDATVTKRIDFAGARVVGVRMPQARYEQLKNARRLGVL